MNKALFFPQEKRVPCCYFYKKNFRVGKKQISCETVTVSELWTTEKISPTVMSSPPRPPLHSWLSVQRLTGFCYRDNAVVRAPAKQQPLLLLQVRHVYNLLILLSVQCAVKATSSSKIQNMLLELMITSNLISGTHATRLKRSTSCCVWVFEWGISVGNC